MNHQEWANRSLVALVNRVKSFSGGKKFISYKGLWECIKCKDGYLGFVATGNT